MVGASALELRALTKSYGSVQAVRGVDLVLQRGNFFTLLGPSGSGKTTILRMIAGFVPATSGAIMANGKDISKLPPNRRDVGLVFQSYALFPHMTVAENIRFPLRIRHWSRAAIDQRVDEMLNLVHLEDLRHRRPDELSGGQQQRVALGRALSFRPSLLLMDEPLGALDQSLRTEMQQEIRRIQRQAGATALYVTHDKEEALALSTHIGVIRDGRLLQVATAQEVYERPVDSFVARLFGELNRLPLTDVVEVDSERVRGRFLQWELEFLGRLPPSGGPLIMIARPSQVGLWRDEGGLRLRGITVDCQFLGETTRVSVEIPGLAEPLVAIVRTAEGRQLTLGGEVEVSLVPEELVCVEDTLQEGQA